MMRNRWVLIPAVAAAFGLFAAGCGDDKGSSGGSGATSGASAATTTLAPQTGGTLTFGEYSEPAGLDPIVSTGQGTTGAIEMVAVYDTILRWNPQTGKYENRTADSVSSNADFTEWTLKLKPGVKFSDGTDYDAEAVKFGMNRHRSGQAGAPACADYVACPRNSTSSGVYMGLVKDIQVVDKLTLKFSLSDPWATFQYALSAEPSMIPSPTALKKCDPTKNPNTCDYNLKPVGAGPFIVDSFKPKDSINMVRNPNYWGGQVYLDGVKFVNLNDVGGTKTYEAFKANQLQGAFLRDPNAVTAAHADKAPGVSTMEQGGGLFLINIGATVNCSGGKPEPTCSGKPDGQTPTNPVTKNVTIRQAIAAAIDPKVLDARGNNGKGLPSSEFVQSDFRWYPGPNGPTYDLSKAKQLVAQARAQGWDGKVRLLYNNSPLAQATGLATQTMLEAAGMAPSLDTTKDTTAQVQFVATVKDYDVTGWGLAISPDDGALWALAQNLSSTSPSNRVGYSNATVDQTLKDLRVATTDDQKKALYKKLFDQITIDVPFLVWSKIEEFTVFSPKVHGVLQANRAMVIFSQAWLEK